MLRGLLAAAVLAALLVVPASAVPKHVVDAIVHVESGGNARATGRAGEIGLMQIKCSTARSVGFRGSCVQLYDPGTNRKYGSAYLRLALARAGGDLDTALSLYQRGVYSKYRGCSSYCRKVKRAMR